MVNVQLISAKGPTTSVDKPDREVWDFVKHEIRASLLEIVHLGDGNVMLVDEEGLLKEGPTNALATRLAYGKTRIDPVRGIVGDVAIVPMACIQ